MDEKKKKIVIGICLVFVLIIAIFGISYAAFRFVGQGQQVNQITTGTISMNYAEGTNVIRLNNGLPTTDATGMTRLNEGEYFDFSVTTNITGGAVINWEIAAEDFTDNTFDGANVKFYLTKIVEGKEVGVNSDLPAVYSEQTSENVSTGRPANMMSLLTGTTNIQGEEITNYRLRLYVNEGYNPQGDGGGLVFKTRINVYGKVSTESLEPSVLRDYGDGVGRLSADFHTDQYKDKITSIVIKKDTNVPSTAIEVEDGKGNYWDVSEAQKGSVIAYLEDDGSGNGTYQVTIGGYNGVEANENSSVLFADFIQLKNIDLTNLDTSNVTNMSYMFENCNRLTGLNLINFDTANVINMENMFSGCSSLTSLNLTNFDTLNVKNMSKMFSGCSSLPSLDLTSFDTSNVTMMSSMFQLCSNLITLDLTSFNTSNVINMSGMFYSCSSLTKLDLTSFNTSKVIIMGTMFESCSSLTNIAVSNLWTTENAAHTVNMFRNCGTDHVTIV